MAVAKKSATNPADDLKKVVRSACEAKSLGNDKQAIEILKRELPLKIAPWARSCRLNGKEKKEFLKALFQSELERADDLLEQKQKLEKEVTSRIQNHFESEMMRLKSSIESQLKKIKPYEFEEIPFEAKPIEPIRIPEAVSKSTPASPVRISESHPTHLFKLPPKPHVSQKEDGIPFDDLEAILNEAIKRC
jgi:hypothetical protein